MFFRKGKITQKNEYFFPDETLWTWYNENKSIPLYWGRDEGSL